MTNCPTLPAELRHSHLLLLVQPGRLLLQRAQLLLGQQQLLAGLLQLLHQLVVGLPQLDVLHLGDVLLAVELLALLLQLGDGEAVTRDEGEGLGRQGGSVEPVEAP